MNKVILIGRLTKDPEVRYSQGDNALAIARYSVAVDRKFKKAGEQETDFINCVAFGKAAEFAEKYLKQGTKMAIEGRIQTGSYTNKEGQKVYTTDIVVESQEFAESKKSDGGSSNYQPASRPTPSQAVGDGFLNVSDGIDSDELPFN